MSSLHPIFDDIVRSFASPQAQAVRVFDPFANNAHVHPAMAGVVNSVCAPTGVAVKVKAMDGTVYHYTSTHTTAGAATLEALDLFGPGAVITTDSRP